MARAGHNHRAQGNQPIDVRVAEKSARPRGGTVSYIDSEHSAKVRPSSLFCARLTELYSELLGALSDDTLRRVATWKLEGYSNEEIAEKLGCSLRSVERKLALIRQQWIDSDET